MNNKGFSLAELLVVVAIMALITTVVVFNYRKYESVSVVEQAAQEVDLAIRTAQVSASSGREHKPLNKCGGFSVAYGVNFSKGANYYRYFAEQPQDCVATQLVYRYIYLSTDRDVSLIGTIPLKTGFIVEDILVSTDGGIFTSLGGPLEEINIGFGSGRLAAIIRSEEESGPVYVATQIVLITPLLDRRYVTVFITGTSFITNTEYSGPAI